MVIIPPSSITSAATSAFEVYGVRTRLEILVEKTLRVLNHECDSVHRAAIGVRLKTPIPPVSLND
jgi:hypothetical protein